MARAAIQPQNRPTMPLRARSSAPLREGYRARQAIGVPGVSSRARGIIHYYGRGVRAVEGLGCPSWRRARLNKVGVQGF